MAKANKGKRKIVTVEYNEYIHYKLNVLVPTDMPANELKIMCTSWPDSMLKGTGDPDFDYDFTVVGEERIDDVSYDHHFEMIRKEGRLACKYYDVFSRQDVEVVI